MIRFVEVGLTYPGPPPVPALRPCDLSVAPGEYLSVVGPSGSGKSTFLNIVGLLDRPTAGRYELAGIDTGALSEAERTALRAHRIGFVFQAFHLLAHRCALDNVALGQLYTGVSPAQRRRAAARALAQVGLSHRKLALPTTLSGGERQRVAVARALVGGPSMLLCDEPTGNLDTANTAAVLDLMEDLHRGGLTLVVITHNPAIAARAQRTVSIVDGVLHG